VKSRSLFAAGAFAAVATLGAPASAWVSKELRDWSVDCTNGLTCNMGFADWGATGLQYVGFQRRGGPDAAVELKLRALPDFAPGSQPDATYRFTVDGQQLLSLAAGDLKPDEGGSWYLFSDPAKVPALLAAMKTGKTMQVEVSSGKGRQVLPVKLSGVTAAMLYIDEVQGRLGRTDALEAKGDMAPPADAVARDIASLDDLPEIVRKDFTESGGACADIDAATIGQFQGFELSLGTTRVIAVPCGMGGAYNQPYALYVGYDVIVERVSFPYMDNGRPTTMSTAYNLDFNPVTKKLTSFFKGRGIGDCGQFYTWELDTGSNALDFLEERAKGDCDEKEGGPETFPIVWQAKP
jgi:hypothetical protein